MSVSFYWLVECPNCEYEFHHGVNLSLHDDHMGLPVIPVDMLSQTSVRCPRCTVKAYFGDLYDTLYVEGNDDPEPDEAAD